MPTNTSMYLHRHGIKERWLRYVFAPTLEHNPFADLWLCALQLLYSLYSSACIINPEYADPEVFDQVFDIFSTQSNYASHQIEYSFNQVNTNYSWYDSERLNASYQSVSETYQTNATPDSGYLFATLTAYNASGSANITGTGGGPGGGSGDSSNSSNTALAM